MNMSDEGSDIQPYSETIRTGRPWWQVCCVGCLLLIVAVAGGVLFLIRSSGQTSQSLMTLPANYPQDLQLYRIEDASSITFLPGKNKSKILQTISAPLKLFASALGMPAASVGSSTSPAAITTASQALDVYGSKLEGMDSVLVSWKQIQASHQDVMGYYLGMVARAGMSVTTSTDALTGTDTVVAIRDDAVMHIRVQSIPDAQGLEQVVIAITYANRP